MPRCACAGTRVCEKKGRSLYPCILCKMSDIDGKSGIDMPDLSQGIDMPDLAELRLIKSFIAKHKLNPIWAKGLLSALNYRQRHFVLKGFKTEVIGMPAMDQLSKYIEECKTTGAWNGSTAVPHAAAPVKVAVEVVKERYAKRHETPAPTNTSKSSGLLSLKTLAARARANRRDLVAITSASAAPPKPALRHDLEDRVRTMADHPQTPEKQVAPSNAARAQVARAAEARARTADRRGVGALTQVEKNPARKEKQRKKKTLEVFGECARDRLRARLDATKSVAITSASAAPAVLSIDHHLEDGFRNIVYPGIDPQTPEKTVAPSRSTSSWALPATRSVIAVGKDMNKRQKVALPTTPVVS